MDAAFLTDWLNLLLRWAHMIVGIAWVGASFGISYLFERRSLAMGLINGGYHAVQFTLFGLILGLMG